MQIETGVPLKPYNTFGLPATAGRLVRIRSEADVRAVLDHPETGRAPKFVLGGGSNVILTRDMPELVLKVEVPGLRLAGEDADAWIVEAGAGVPWHTLVAWTLDQGWPGLENMALIPGTVGAAPVQNIGAYGLELKDRFESLDTVDLVTGRAVTLYPDQCEFGYRDSIFKQALGAMPQLQARYSNAVGARTGSNAAVQTSLDKLLQERGLAQFTAADRDDPLGAERRSRFLVDRRSDVFS